MYNIHLHKNPVLYIQSFARYFAKQWFSTWNKKKSFAQACFSHIRCLCIPCSAIGLYMSVVSLQEIIIIVFYHSWPIGHIRKTLFGQGLWTFWGGTAILTVWWSLDSTRFSLPFSRLLSLSLSLYFWQIPIDFTKLSVPNMYKPIVLRNGLCVNFCGWRNRKNISQ